MDGTIPIDIGAKRLFGNIPYSSHAGLTMGDHSLIVIGYAGVRPAVCLFLSLEIFVRVDVSFLDKLAIHMIPSLIG